MVSFQGSKAFLVILSIPFVLLNLHLESRAASQYAEAEKDFHFHLPPLKQQRRPPLSLKGDSKGKKGNRHKAETKAVDNEPDTGTVVDLDEQPTTIQSSGRRGRRGRQEEESVVEDATTPKGYSELAIEDKVDARTHGRRGRRNQQKDKEETIQHEDQVQAVGGTTAAQTPNRHRRAQVVTSTTTTKGNTKESIGDEVNAGYHGKRGRRWRNRQNEEEESAIQGEEHVHTVGETPAQKPNRHRLDQAVTTTITTTTKTTPRYQLRFNWSNLEPLRTKFAQRIEHSQKYCHAESNPNNSSAAMKFYVRQQSPDMGLGNQLHRWSAHLCGALENDAMVVFRGKLKWVMGASDECDAEFWRLRNREIKNQRRQLDDKYAVPPGGYSYLSCFFNKESKTDCAPPEEMPKTQSDPRVILGTKFFTHQSVNQQCYYWLGRQKSNIAEWRAASMEWLFSSVTDLVVTEAQRQIHAVFGEEGLPDPDDLVMVHIRWGDARTKGKLIPMESYIRAIHQLHPNRTQPLHVYLSTETPQAYDEFMQQKADDWIVHTSNIMTPRNNTKMGDFAGGQVGLQSMGALLLSMEANSYVLTTTSHWSRLINELRRGVVDTRCGNCTKLVDLNYGEW